MSDLLALAMGAAIVALVNLLPMILANPTRKASIYEDRYDLFNH